MNEWISVKERLPNPYEEVLVWNKNRKRFDLASYGEGYDAFWEGEFSIDEDIDYWQPLPQPPKKCKDE